MDTFSLFWLLPIVFMLHDFEEIIMFRPWFKKNRDFILSKFPKIGVKIVKHFEGLTTSSYAFVVAGEFLVISAITLISVIYNLHYLWFGTLIAFGAHLIVHIAQFIIIRKYIPVILTSLPALAYCLYAAYVFACGEAFNTAHALIWTAAAFAALIINFILWQNLALKFERFLKNYK